MATPPLNPHVRIVDEQGRPTPEFIRWAQSQRDVNQDIPTTPQATSGVLDKLGDAQGSILYRDTGNWNALAPGVPGRFLKTNGAGANPAWDIAAGAFTALSDTPNSYMGGSGKVVAVKGDETGLEFVAGGGGGTTGYVGVYYGSSSTDPISGSAFATKGNIFTADEDASLYAVQIYLTASQTVMMTLAELNGSNQITSIVWQSSPVVVGGSARWVNYFIGSAAAMIAGTRYAILATRTDGTSTSVLALSFPGADPSIPELPLGFTHVISARWADIAPAVSDTVATFSPGHVRMRLGLSFHP